MDIDTLVSTLAVITGLFALYFSLRRELGGQIDGLEKSLTKRIDGVESSLAKRIDGVEDRIDRLDGRIDRLEDRVSTLDDRIYVLAVGMRPLIEEAERRAAKH